MNIVLSWLIGSIDVSGGRASVPFFATCSERAPKKFMLCLPTHQFGLGLPAGFLCREENTTMNALQATKPTTSLSVIHRKLLTSSW